MRRAGREAFHRFFSVAGRFDAEPAAPELLAGDLHVEFVVLNQKKVFPRKIKEVFLWPFLWGAFP